MACRENNVESCGDEESSSSSYGEVWGGSLSRMESSLGSDPLGSLGQMDAF